MIKVFRKIISWTNEYASRSAYRKERKLQRHIKLAWVEKNMILSLDLLPPGKTRIAALAAYDINAEIISADSRQVYQKWISVPARI